MYSEWDEIADDIFMFLGEAQITKMYENRTALAEFVLEGMQREPYTLTCNVIDSLSEKIVYYVETQI